jgi:hypothetical protein
MLAETLIASTLGVAGTIFAAYIWEKQIRDRVFVRRIKSSDDADIEGMLELYLSLFPDDGVNYSCDDLIELTRAQDEFDEARHVKGENIMLVARFKSEVAGFLFCHFYPERKKAIVSYYGINKQIVEARRSAASRLLRSLHTLLKKRKCDFIFFDALRPGQDHPRAENSERKARLALLKQSAKALGLHACELQFDYRSPKITLAEGTHEDCLSLLVVPLSSAPVSHFAKTEVGGFLRFVYQDCYGDIYRTDDPRFQEYQKYLSKRVEDYEKSLPEQVKAL